MYYPGPSRGHCGRRHYISEHFLLILHFHLQLLLFETLPSPEIHFLHHPHFFIPIYQWLHLSSLYGPGLFGPFVQFFQIITENLLETTLSLNVLTEHFSGKIRRPAARRRAGNPIRLILFSEKVMKLDFEIRFCVKHIAHGGKVMVMQWDWLFQTFHLGSLFFDNFPNVKQIATC